MNIICDHHKNCFHNNCDCGHKNPHPRTASCDVVCLKAEKYGKYTNTCKPYKPDKPKLKAVEFIGIDEMRL